MDERKLAGHFSCYRTVHWMIGAGNEEVLQSRVCGGCFEVTGSQSVEELRVDVKGGVILFMFVCASSVMKIDKRTERGAVNRGLCFCSRICIPVLIYI